MAKPANGQNIAADSAKVLSTESGNFSTLRIIKKKMAIRKILNDYNSPFLDSTETFVSTCMNYDLDCYLLPSIAGLESTFGNFVHPNSNNPFGWGGGYIIFASWDEAIKTVGRNLKKNYINKGADTIEKIAPIYAESNTWASRVSYFRNQFELEEDKINSVLSQNQVNL